MVVDMFTLKFKDCDNEVFTWYHVKNDDVVNIIENCLIEAKKIEIIKEK